MGGGRSRIAWLTVLAVAGALAGATAQQATSSAASAQVVVWPGSVVTYRYLTTGTSYHTAVVSAVAAWNRLRLGVHFERISTGKADLAIGKMRGRCLLGRGGAASQGFQTSGGVIHLTRSCPLIVRSLLVAHELGRVLGLPNDDTHCSLMNSHARSDGLTYVVPAKCSYRHPPAWIGSLVDPGTVTLAREMYTPPLPPGAIALSVDAQGVPQVGWDEPTDATAATSVLVRTPGTCPTDRDVAAGDGTAVYDAAATAGTHSVVDSAFPRTGESDCYRAFLLNEFGRAADSPDAITYTFGGPLASFSIASSPTAGAPTAFDDTSTGPTSSIVHWHWDFGDPASGANDTVDTSDPAVGRQPSHVYATAGNYMATLTVTDAAGRTGSMLQVVVVGAGS